ncbi:Eco57I restriction-modification methylase domain-containing protein [Paenibacillus sp. P22]|uniref:Eco57I restriction-modification methylase domain-containing protein n=1 Tax=Paenibacillus sp. P22 TaxID=483908 RepID=UPI00066029AB|nr:Eco57I restriction-modification methylase domain-containing protein [Paenibacillus sp. P22]
MSIDVVAVEIDEALIPVITKTLDLCSKLCQKVGIEFSSRIVNRDFLEFGLQLITNQDNTTFTSIIVNPPYKKIAADSTARILLRQIGVETTNLYTGFVAVSKRLLAESGQLVAITPRSFCNGTYYTKFRVDFLSDMSFKKIHLFESRREVFSEDDVLQENIIYLAEKNKNNRYVSITTSVGTMTPSLSYRLHKSHLVHPNDEDMFIRLAKDRTEVALKNALKGISSTLEQIGLQVSTGRVVDFRTKENLRYEDEDIGDDVVPLIYPLHFSNGHINWPVSSAKKPNGIHLNNDTINLLLPSGNYVLVKRFSAKEEPKRVVPAIYDQSKIEADFVGFENHVNYFHTNNTGLPLELAKGLALYLSSTVIDRYFRQFNGHTQVNVGDLKSLPYPTKSQLIEMGELIGENFPEQEEVDLIIERTLGVTAN